MYTHVSKCRIDENKIENKNHWDSISPQSEWQLSIKQTKCWPGCGRKGNCWWECNLCNPMEISMAVPEETKNRIAI
jgi:hypothetical protein